MNLRLSECSNQVWLCFSDGTIDFSIKRKWRGIERTWEYNKVKFTVLNEDDFATEKLPDHVFFILAHSLFDSGKNTPDMIYSYTLNDGLVGITMYMESADKVLIPVTYVKYQ